MKYEKPEIDEQIKLEGELSQHGTGQHGRGSGGWQGDWPTDT